jgi:HlyD family secretion protein
VKIWRIAVVLVICLVSVGSLSCNIIGGNGSENTQQLAEVVSGNLTVTISGSGSIEASRKLSLSFGSSGRIDKIYIKEGDEVSTGKVLANLETDALKLALNQSKLSYTQAQVAITQAELAVTQAYVALLTAELDLEHVQNPYRLPHIETAQADVVSGRLAVRNAKDHLAVAPPEKKEEWAKMVISTEVNLVMLEDKLNILLNSEDIKEIEIKKQQLVSANQSLELSKQSLELSKQSVDPAKQAIAQAQKQLDGAVITAPFNGIITSINAEEGDTVTSALPIIDLMDFANKELVVEIDELDVTKIRPEQRVIIEADALPGIILKGKVAYISPVARNSAGLMLYKVKIHLAVSEGSQLRVGMSATAEIVIEERANVLLVPNQAIKKDSQGNKIVRVKEGEQIQERPVATGISDGSLTEILSGLSEGDTVVVK